jgi:hypothetical protein
MTRWEMLYAVADTEAEKLYVSTRARHTSNSAAADECGVNRRTIDRCINKLEQEAAVRGLPIDVQDMPKVLLLDIETAPIMGYVWSMWQDGLTAGIEGIKDDWYIMCAAWKWMHETDVTVRALPDYDQYNEDDTLLINDLASAMDEADWVITHNGDKFDNKRINTRLILNGGTPIRPFKSIDTLKIAKRHFSFTSNKLDYLGQMLCGESKMEHDGFKLWKECMGGCPVAWDKMRKYNIQDVLLLEKVYKRLSAWDRSHPNALLYGEENGDVIRCTGCMSTNVKPIDKRSTTAVSAFQMYECGDCGRHMRGRKSVRGKAANAATLTNAR